MLRRRLIELMHKMYGKTPGKICRDCAHFVEKRAGKTCDVTTGTRPWDEWWPACGKFEEAKPPA